MNRVGIDPLQIIIYIEVGFYHLFVYEYFLLATLIQDGYQIHLYLVDVIQQCVHYRSYCNENVRDISNHAHLVQVLAVEQDCLEDLDPLLFPVG